MNAPDSDSQDTLIVARNLAMLGQLSDARSVLVAGLRLARGCPEDLCVMAGELLALYERMREPIGALSCAWHLRDFQRMESLEARVPARLAARSWVLRAREAQGDERAECGVHATFQSGPAKADEGCGRTVAWSPSESARAAGASPYGALDMAGNLWEWVADGYDARAYESASETDPRGPTDARYGLIRGGSFDFGRDSLRAAERRATNLTRPSPSIGFRCVKR